MTIPVRGTLALPHRRVRGSSRFRPIEQTYHHFIAPNAAGGGSGSFESPWTLSEFLANPGTVNAGERTGMRCLAGSELYEQSGSFTWHSSLNGSSGDVSDLTKKIQLVAYEPDGGLPTISNSASDNSQTLRIDGTHVCLRGIRIRKNNTIRSNGRGTAIWLRGAFDNKPTGTGILIHCWFEDGANGLFTGNSASTDFQGGDWTVYGCVAINNGEDDGPRNHGFYTRHQGSGRMRFEKNIIGMGLANSLMVYEETVGVDAITNVDLIDNICFQAGILGTVTGNWWNIVLGGGGAADGPARECTVTGNILYHADNASETANFQLGSTGATNEHTTVEDNYLYGGQQDDIVRIHTFRIDGNPTLVFRNNSVYRGTDRAIWTAQSGGLSAWTWENNTYYADATGGNLVVHGGTQRTLAGFVTAASIGGSDAEANNPSTTQVFVKAVNTYQARAHVFIRNWGADADVPLNLDAVLANGEQFKVYRAQNPHVAISQGGNTTHTYTTGGWSYVMENAATTIQAPIGTCPRTAPPLNDGITVKAECLIIEKVT